MFVFTASSFFFHAPCNAGLFIQTVALVGPFAISALTCTQENQIPALLRLHKMRVDALARLKSAQGTPNKVGDSSVMI